jgi:ATP-dependent DNA ligase
VNLEFIKPMECLAVRNVPTGGAWTYEVKLDGFRIEAIRSTDHVTLYSKNGRLLTSHFSRIAMELEKVPPGRHWMVNWLPE